MRARRAGLVLVATLVLTSVLPVGRAGAAVRTAAAPRARISLLGQPAWSALGADVPLQVRLDGDTTGLQVRAIVHTYVTSRTAFERSVTGDRLGSTIAAPVASPVDSLPPVIGGRVFKLSLQDPNQPRDPNRLRVTLPRGLNAGVFPVEIELWDPDAGQRVDAFVTHLVAVMPNATGTSLGQPLRVSWIWHLGADPAYDPTGKLSTVFQRAVAAGGRLSNIAALYAGAPDVPITLAPNPETLDAWNTLAATDATSASTLAEMGTAARQRQLLSGPFVPINVPGLENAGLGGETALELAQGADTLGATLADRVDPRTSLVQPLDSSTLARLREAGVDRLVLPESALQPSRTPQQFTTARPFAIDSDGRHFAAVQTDDSLAALLDGPGSPALRAEHLLAGLAVVAQEQPANTRGVVLDTPFRWNPDRAAVTAVLAGLRKHPLLRTTSLDDLFSTVPAETDRRDAPVVRSLVPVVPTPPSVTARQYRTARAKLNSFSDLVGESDPVVVKGERSLLVTLTSAWTGATGRARAAAELARTSRAMTQFVSAIPAPETRAVTLTSRDAAIPISILNQTGRRVRVKVRLLSDKLLFPKGAERVIELAPRNTTVRFDVETRSPGTFPLRVALTSEDGSFAIWESRYTVRSTVVSGVGVFLTIGAGLFLAVWWITHWRRSRRVPRRAPALAT